LLVSCHPALRVAVRAFLKAIADALISVGFVPCTYRGGSLLCLLFRRHYRSAKPTRYPSV
jgi:hypothetical protein